eukprot:PITA_27994
MGQSMKLFCIIIVVLIIITLHAHICHAQQHTCRANVTSTTGRKFESNLKAVLDNLVQHTSQTAFNTGMYGQSPDQVYGLLQCTGDTTVERCYNCSLQASASLGKFCGNASGGLIWLGDCFLRYENYSFIGQLDTGDGWYLYNVNNVSSPDAFMTALGNLFTKLSGQAASSSKFFASGTITDSLSRKIYGLVQCWRDISSDDCTTCLSNTINYIFTVYTGRQGARGLIGSCMVRYETYPFFNSSGLPPPPAKAPASTEAIAEANAPLKQITSSSTRINHSGKSSNKMPLILGVFCGSLVMVFLCLFATRRRLKSAIFRNRYEGHAPVKEDTQISEERQIVFTMEALLAATENFHDNNKLGEGGFGAVYKGTTEDGKEIAVKKLSVRSMQGKKEFLNEVRLMAKIQHRNLVNLLGCCAEGIERLLVYEYLPNKSLDKILFDPNKRNQLDWQKRYNIIVGVARGLLYLHEDSPMRIIHRDIKASNILLDERLNAKIADFGLARLFPEDESQLTTRVAGTYGYMAPEYAMQGKLSVKVDVYSFGVVLLQLIAGRKSVDYNLAPEMQMLVEWAWRLYKLKDIMQMIDPSIIERCDHEQACRCIHVGLLCTQADASLRPQMSTVNLMLSSHSVTLPNPTKPAFVGSHASQSANSTGSGQLPHSAATTSSYSPVVAPPSNADDSITELEPR